jgi:hypothetical protein
MPYTIQSLNTSSQPAEHRDHVGAGLLFGCPMGECLPDCPLAGVRKLTPAERWETFKALDNQEVDAIHAHHKQCLRRRESPEPLA